MILAFLLVRLHEVQRAIVVTTVVRSRSCHTALKFSRSPDLDNHLSESIHTCTIDTLYHSTTSDPRVHSGGGGGGGGGARGQKVGFLRLSFLEVHILTTTCQKAFILAP